MNKDGKKAPDNKKGFPGILLLFIIGLIVILAFQNLSGAGAGSVAFSHQIDHLVNLDLVDPSESKKRAGSAANLVSFTGLFREEATKKGEESYRFISLLNSSHDLQASLTLTRTELNTLQAQVLQVATYFYQVSGFEVPSSGVVVFPTLSDYADYNTSVIIHGQPEALKGQLTLPALRKFYKGLPQEMTEEDKGLAQEKFNQLLQDLRSNLGVSKQDHKDLFNQIAGEIQVGSHATLGLAINKITTFLEEIEKPVNRVRFQDLRSTWSYNEKLGEYLGLSEAYENTVTQLDKARVNVQDSVWFYNGQEITSRQLEEKNPEEYRHWYKKADKEWKEYHDQNKGLIFSAHDQPVTPALERTFRSEENSPGLFGHLFTFLPIILIFLLLYFIFSRQMKGMGGNAMNFGKSPAKKIEKSTKKVTFDDVAGVDEAKEELEEIVDFLKEPERYQKLGARIPKGVLLVGPPGTGKTLLARAVAGEANAPFYAISGSDFVEMFVGVGASRVRDLFKEARNTAPAIIFIDEIDAVGRHRGSGLGGGHDEREQTLNQLLVEVDGMDNFAAVIVIAATNRPDVLDPALLRPGRFDRTVHVDLAAYQGRLEILKVHAKKVKLGPDVDLPALARRSQGQSGAELESIVNEAALGAAKRRAKYICQEDFIVAIEKVVYGKERRSLKLDQEDIKITAYHESGHTIVAIYMKSTDPVLSATIIPRAKSLGSTNFEMKTNRVNYRVQECRTQLATLMGGRVAEEILNGDPSSGASQDIKMATNLARNMVAHWGMSEVVGMNYLGDDNQGSLMAGFQEKGYSEETARVIDEEVSKLLNEGHEKAREILNGNRDILDNMAKALLEFETLPRKDLDLIMERKFSFEEKREELDTHEETKTVVPPAIPAHVEKEIKRRNKKKNNDNPHLKPI